MLEFKSIEELKKLNENDLPSLANFKCFILLRSHSYNGKYFEDYHFQNYENMKNWVIKNFDYLKSHSKYFSIKK